MENNELEDINDADLLDRFVQRRDQSAFAELVRRHGGMVLATIRRLVAQREDADDAFQATFLALAKSAARLRRKAAVAGWLHTTARRCATDIIRTSIRWDRTSSSQAEEDSTVMAHHDDDPSLRVTRDELTKLLDEELTALPSKIKDAVVLCDIEGLSHREAATVLRISVATVGNHVKKGRELLRSRLARRGIALTSAGLAAWSADCEAASSILTDAFISGLTTNATLYATGSTAIEIGLPARVTQAAGGVIWANYTALWSTYVIAFLATCAAVPCFAAMLDFNNVADRTRALHYWRFEDEPGFFEDSIGATSLAGTIAAIEPVSLPSKMRGQSFRSDGNRTAADCIKERSFLYATSVTPVPPAFTIELFIHADDLSPQGNNGLAILAAQARDCTKPPLFSWALGISKVQRSGKRRRELVLTVSDGISFHSLGSGILVDVQQDYFVSASFDLANELRFCVKNLTTGQVQTRYVTHDLSHLNAAGSIKLGGGPYDWAFFDGLIDEVRLSEGVVPVEALLVNMPSHSLGRR